MFLFCAIFFSVVLIRIPFFMTVDGPSHLYNSQLIIQLLSGDEFLAQYFSLNVGFIPNYLGHLILILTALFRGVWNAHDGILLAYVFGVGYSFRYLVFSIGESSKLMSFFIFPFLLSFHFLMGFYNFSIALMFFFFTTGYC